MERGGRYPGQTLKFGRLVLGKADVLGGGFVAVLLVYFARFVGPGLAARFNPDDPMNIYYYWVRGPWALMADLVLFFKPSWRPMGGAYFGLIYHFFGVNPLPYHVATTFLLATSTFLAYRLGTLITGSKLAGGFAAFPVAYHAGMAQLVYLPAFAYDLLCFNFYIFSLNYYLSVRNRASQLAWRQVALFLFSYLCALGSKEVACTLPLIVLLYEAIWHRPARLSAGTAVRWLKIEALPGLLAAVLTLAYLVGKTMGPEALARLPGYRMEITWNRYWESMTRFVNTILYQPPNALRLDHVVLLSVTLVALAWWMGRRDLLFIWTFLWITPLPMTFIEGRDGGCLYIPLVGWAIFAAALCASLSNALANRFRARTTVQTGVVMVAVAAMWLITESKNDYLAPGIRNPGELTWSILEQVKALQPSVRPGSRIYVVKGPFQDWDLKFIFELTYHDHSVRVRLGEKEPLGLEELAKMDYVFTYENGKLRRLKSP